VLFPQLISACFSHRKAESRSNRIHERFTLAT
jgi:hypothetical protein